MGLLPLKIGSDKVELENIQDSVISAYQNYQHVVATDDPFVNNEIKESNNEFTLNEIKETILLHPNLGANGAKNFSEMEKNLLAKTKFNFRNVVGLEFPRHQDWAQNYSLQDDAKTFGRIVSESTNILHDASIDVRLGALPRWNYTTSVKYASQAPR